MSARSAIFPDVMPSSIALFVGLLVLPIIVAAPLTAQPLVDEVNPFIGTSYGAHTFPGAIVPWGMVSVSPHNTFGDPSAYYHHWENRLHGFGHVHMSGVGCFDAGNIVLMPTTGAIATEPREYRSPMSAEAASPGYYRCRVDRYEVEADMTATTRAGLSRYVFSRATDRANVLVDVTQGLTPSRGAHLRVVADDEIEGYNTSGGFCGSPTHQRVYFVARFSRAASAVKTWSNGLVGDRRELGGTSIGAALRFDAAAGDTILVKVGISFTSVANARRNLEWEIPDWSFERVHGEARARWETELGRIRISGGTPEQRRVFTTALYHAMIHPNVFDDVGGTYRRMGDRGTGHAVDYTRYTVYSLWDTYRTLHPLLALVWPDRQRDMTRTLVEMVRESGWLPKWELYGMDSYTMNGDPASIVIADTWAKGIRDIDLATAFEGMLRNGTDPYDDNLTRPSINAYLEQGYIPADRQTGRWVVYGPTSTSLEYYVADDAVARVAAALCRGDEHARFSARAAGWRRLFDASMKLFRPRNEDGRWVEPFDPSEYDRQFTEGTAHHYRFFTPHDMPELIRHYGGDRAFVDSLQSFFDEGRFLWNEHDLAFPWLFTLVDGESWRTHTIVRRLLGDFRDAPDGIRTNEDAGAISSWYVLSSIGLYPVAYATDEMQLGSPLFDTVTITPSTPGARPFTIVAAGASEQRRYVVGAELDGRTLERPQLRAAEIARGGVLELTMSDAPGTWGRMLRGPSLISSATTSQDGPPRATLTWSAARDAELYRVQVAREATFCDPLLDTLVHASDTSLLAPTGATASRFWWRVATVDAHGAEAWSGASHVELRPLPYAIDGPLALWLEHGSPGMVRVHYRAGDGEDAVLSIHNGLGIEMRRIALMATHGVPASFPLETRELPRGIYFCRFVSSGRSLTAPLIVGR